MVALGPQSEQFEKSHRGDFFGRDGGRSEIFACKSLPHKGSEGWAFDAAEGQIVARYYDPELGRFVGRDPLKYVDGYSMYRAYFTPNLLDPSGMHCCDKQYQDCLDYAQAAHDRCLDEADARAAEMANELRDAAQLALDVALEYANQSLENMLAECDEIDDSTFPGSIAKTTCVYGAHSAHFTATTAAWVANRAALIALTGIVASFLAGETLGCTYLHDVDKSACKDEYDKCMANHK
jgi:RHS repeat-associated protein